VFLPMDPLNSLWEGEPSIRNRARENSCLTTWPSPTTIGIPSQKACALNAKVLEKTALWWSAASEVPAAIPIDRLRAEVRFVQTGRPSIRNIFLDMLFYHSPLLVTMVVKGLNYH
jgi:hypothetical protein